MPAIVLPRPLLYVDLPDLVEGKTIIKYRAYFTNLESPQDIDSGITSAIITTVIRAFFAQEDGNYGNRMLDVRERIRYLRADNYTLVTAAGEIAGEMAKMTPEAWAQLRDHDPRDLYYQGDFFLKARKENLVIDDLLLYHMTQAIAMGSYH